MTLLLDTELSKHVRRAAAGELKVVQLREIARELGIEKTIRMRKKDLIEAIVAVCPE